MTQDFTAIIRNVQQVQPQGKVLPFTPIGFSEGRQVLSGRLVPVTHCVVSRDVAKRWLTSEGESFFPVIDGVPSDTVNKGALCQMLGMLVITCIEDEDLVDPGTVSFYSETRPHLTVKFKVEQPK